MAVRGSDGAERPEPERAMVRHANPILTRDNRRVLVVDDNPALHDDYRKILSPRGSEVDDELAALEAELFGVDTAAKATPATQVFELSSTFQGEEALDAVRQANEENDPFAIAFVDVRMPPGIDGIETATRLIAMDDELQIVICTAYSDHGWDDVVAALGETDRVLILKKPFDTIEVRQLAHALQRKWVLGREARGRRRELEALVAHRTQELESANARLRTEMAEKERIEGELRLAHKLEAVGQLASGIAHEINTPIQYVSDNLHFLQTAFDDFTSLVAACQRERRSLAQVEGGRKIAERLEEAEEEADVNYLGEHVPRALEQSLEGVTQVSRIVQAMKDFAHPGSTQMAPADLNRAIESTLTVARNEYKLVADVALELGEIDTVTCHIGDLNQVFLNLIVNAAHAITDVVEGSDERGLISIRTSQEGEEAVITIRDTGSGIPEAVRDRIFDPFFTTKEVGRGTGQGLAIARTIVHEKHGGRIGVESQPGRGTTFEIRIPIEGSDEEDDHA